MTQLLEEEEERLDGKKTVLVSYLAAISQLPNSFKQLLHNISSSNVRLILA